jgi:hypothetical protein
VKQVWKATDNEMNSSEEEYEKKLGYLNQGHVIIPKGEATQAYNQVL